MTERGKYIVLEGSDGTGKTIQVERLKQRLVGLALPCLKQDINEPDGVPIASRIRDIIKDGTLQRDALTNILLFNAARRSIWIEEIEPALRRGETVAQARNYISTIVHQGYGEGFSVEDIIRRVGQDVGDNYMNPDLTIVLNLDNHEERNARISRRGQLEVPDTFESRPIDFQERVRLGYLAIAGANNYPVIDASGTLDQVEASIWGQVEPLYA